MLRGLRGKLALVFTVLFGVVAGLAALAQYRQVGQVLDQGDELRLRARAATLLARVEVEPQLVVPLPSLGEKMRLGWYWKRPARRRRRCFTCRASLPHPLPKTTGARWS